MEEPCLPADTTCMHAHARLAGLKGMPKQATSAMQHSFKARSAKFHEEETFVLMGRQQTAPKN
jgi:hypothetical protein